AMAWLMAKETERLDGPLGELFIESVRRAVPSLANATIDEMSDFMRHLDGEHLEGMMSLLKGELFEAMVVWSINAGSDGPPARLHEDRTVPGSHMIMPDSTGTREMLVSLKATDDASYI